MRYRKHCLVAILAALAIGAGVLGPIPTAAEAQGADRDATVPQQVPADAKRTRNPVPASEQSVADGKQIYSSQCAMCHGVSGDGKGELVERFKYTVPDFTDAAFQTGRTDGEFYYVLTHGHGKMRGQGGRLSDETRWHLVNYIRSFAPAD